jgi:penicillin-binding protein 1A
MKQGVARARAAVPTIFRGAGATLRRHPWLIVGALPIFMLMAAALYFATHVPRTPDVANIQKAKYEHPSVVLTADGKELAVFKHENRVWVKLADISPNVLNALIATEDRKFFDHKGLDFRRTIGAALHSARGDLQGGSTITQQLARNLYPEEIGRAPTIARKIKEAITALKIESAYSKEQILETYLNTVPFLYNAYGIEMAARTYFDKSAGQLGVLESATLIGMLKGTSYYNPVLNPERAVQRRNIVLAQMVQDNKLAPAEFDKLKTQPLGLDFERQAEDLGPAPHLAQQLRRWLISWADRKGYNIYADGLVVHTTLDSRLQAMATEAVTRQADKLQAVADKAWSKRSRESKALLQDFVRETQAYQAARKSGLSDELALKKVEADADFMKALWRGKTTLQAAFLAIEPGTGHVKAWVGSRDFEQDQFDHVQQARRQPGSTFKPFVYGAAFEQGIGPMETFVDQAMEFRIDDHTVWKPGDVHETSGLPTTLRDGLIFSKNTITAQLMQRVGPVHVAQTAYAMGVRQSKLDEVPSLALGTSPVTLKEMVSAYGTIANGGNYVEPVLVTSVQNQAGAVLEQFNPAPAEPALAAAAAHTLLDVMRGVVDKGTGAGIRGKYGLRGDLAGKTGTTQDNTDGWFILIHPSLVGGAWVGFNDNRITMQDSWGQGAHNALHIVGDFFQQSLKDRLIDAKAKFDVPRDISMPPAPPAEHMNDWMGGMIQNSPDNQASAQQQQMIALPLPAGASQAPAEAAVVATPPQVIEPPQRDTQWFPQRARATPEYLGGEERRDTAEMGAAPARPQLEPQPQWRAEPRPEFQPQGPPAWRADGGGGGGGGGGGVRILREVTPAQQAPYVVAPQQ